MVYVKEDGSNDFSWNLQYNFLIEKHPTLLEEIAQARFQILAEENPDQAEYYRSLLAQLDQKIHEAWENNYENFGYVESCQVTKQFIKDNDLMGLFEGFSPLSNEIDQEINFSNLEENPQIKIDLTDDAIEALLDEI